MNYSQISLVCIVFLCASIGTNCRELLKKDHKCRNCLKSLLIFGDSLSDQGLPYGLWSFDNKTTPSTSLGYKMGRFTNHQVWSQYLGEKYGMDVLSFAVGGATVNNFSIGVPVTIDTELAEYQHFLASNPPLQEPSVAVVFIGSNDFNAIPKYTSLRSNVSDLEAFLTSLVEGIASTVQRVIQFGYKNVLVVNLPPLELTPQFAGPANTQNRVEFGSLITAVNMNIAKAITAIKATAGPLGVTIIPLDIYSLTINVFNNAQKYGFANISGPCLVTNPPFSNSNVNTTVVSTCSHPEKFFFWDGEHPTETGHRILANDIASTFKSYGLLH
ncbi:hypothetical protein CEUSTIGMA_g4431.t1 [Chlamydomonas eustigma]|uniref:SGNH hydrolase-type esterase domain-containing protein n=1 Tax=Chlamydomonas eustigma TaxID=1157962 RepID=A0A250X1L0_9CHLO|nr:hypothetical protein CEUSTIGMA_g4431.t1 [Chlamydomonas eustigma]|eukprot:GAX76984.1 hypothetical protein CEUSTIGMA_g4431.t1 [Chlamydomonas eustigma]